MVAEFTWLTLDTACCGISALRCMIRRSMWFVTGGGLDCRSWYVSEAAAQHSAGTSPPRRAAHAAAHYPSHAGLSAKRPADRTCGSAGSSRRLWNDVTVSWGPKTPQLKRDKSVALNRIQHHPKRLVVVCNG